MKNKNLASPREAGEEKMNWKHEGWMDRQRLREEKEGGGEGTEGGGGDQYHDSFFLRWPLPNSIH